MSIPSFSEWPDIPQRSAPEADFDAKMYALFQHFATTHRNEMLAFINFLENNSTVINGALNGTTIGLNTPAAGKFTTLLADSLGGAAVQSGATDATAGKLLKLATNGQGVFGLGVTSGNAPAISDFTSPPAAGLYRYLGGSGGATGNPDAAAWWGTCLVTKGLDGDTFYLAARSQDTANSPRVWFGSCQGDGTQLSWNEVITTKGGQTINGNVTLEDVLLFDTNYREIRQKSSNAFGVGIVGGPSNLSGASMAVYGGGHPTVPGNLYLSFGGQPGVGKLIFRHTDGATFKESMHLSPNGNLGVGNPVPPARMSAKTSDTSTRVAEFFAEGAGFDNIVFTAKTARAASSAFSLLKMGTGNFSDVEFDFTGDGLGISDRGWQSPGADYAEFFEWLDGNPNGEIRTGVAVVLEGDKIRPAQEGEPPIGVISANPSVIGDGDIDRWRGKYLCDDFGAYVWEDYEVVSWTEVVTEYETEQEQATEAQEVTQEVIEVVNGKAMKRTITETVQRPLFDEFPLVDEAGNALGTHRAPRMIEVQKEITKEVQHSYAADEVPEGVTVPEDAERVIQKRRKLNPEYDPSQPYVPRAERPEWDMVGLMGKLRLRKGQPVAPNWIKMRDVSAEVEEWLVK